MLFLPRVYYQTFCKLSAFLDREVEIDTRTTTNWPIDWSY